MVAHLENSPKSIEKSLRMITKRALTLCLPHTERDWRESSNEVVQSRVMAKRRTIRDKRGGEFREDIRSVGNEVKKKAN